MTEPDGIKTLVPATWEVPGAGAIPTTPNKGLVAGHVSPVPASIPELVKAGVDAPGALFRAEGTTVAGERTGVIVGVYDTGESDPIERVRDAVLQITPEATIATSNVTRGAGLRVSLPAGSTPGAVVYDYWGRIGYTPTGLALIRFWRGGLGGAEDEALYESIAGSCVFMSSREWSGWEASTTRQMNEAPPPDESARDGQWRWIGWRVGAVFHTKVVPQEHVALFTQAGFRRRDGIVLLAVFLGWIALALALIGFRPPIFIVGGMTVMGGLANLRNHGLRAVRAVAAVLAVLLGIGLLT